MSLSRHQRQSSHIGMVMIAFLLGLTAHATPQESGPSWFKLLPNALASWELRPSGDKPDTYLIEGRGDNGGDDYKILVLFPKRSSAYDIAMAQILSAFREKNLQAVFHLINFEGEPSAGKKVLEEAKTQNFDLIFSMGSDSTVFITGNKDDITIPVVTVCSKDPVLMGQLTDYQSGSGNQIAYTSLDVPITIQMAYLQKLIPNLQNIAVLFAESNISAVNTQVRPLVDFCKKSGINLMEISVKDRDNARAELEAKIPPVTKALLEKDPSADHSIFWITGSTSVFREIETINQHTGKIPVLSAVPNVVGEGDNSAVISIGVSFENNAQLAAIYAVRILTNQVSPGELEVGVVSPPDIAINFKRARAIDLKIPFSFFESAIQIYDHEGHLVRDKGRNVKEINP